MFKISVTAADSSAVQVAPSSKGSLPTLVEEPDSGLGLRLLLRALTDAWCLEILEGLRSRFLHPWLRAWL